MAMFRLASSVVFLLFTLTSLVLQSSSSPVYSSCSSNKLPNKKVYTNCTDLPTLNSTLHWTYTLENSTLSIAFIAPPATPNGWIAWAINPTGTGMAGSQSLIAFKDSNDSMTVKTYNISSYASIVEGKIAFEVPESSAEFVNGVMMIFASVKLPENMTEVNQVWQVGGSVTDGRPAKHAFLPANLNAVGKLQLAEKAATAGVPAGAPAGGPAGSPAGSPASGSGGGSAVAPSSSLGSVSAGVYGVVTIIGCLVGFF
ncbi:putative DOMON domain-containing protein [Helianthus annuus]|uniref:DOMON domain-containing protein n=1 Tax=Helianthus annuus TaxID=4232 RepID=A0A251U7C0_HELAN|nr:auxin-induced in root cultures protein 12 [Helianthus annuus]KAF5796184.1 putative DOMON domain-containing protein [Helianthus annuus]KAJ0554284.1 putative DOMON domain-containing protein [Helianthus annuus]KAJ0898786.1 putative DOMON domain-containing protein [Helianthus annuus]KAJ0902414.1 putative DOMON domain-containing protein [Helianthus annuus]